MRKKPESKVRGPCSRCEHYRQGGSITTLAYSAMLDPMKPRIGRTHSEKQEAERSSVGEFVGELESAKADETEEWNRRPTARMPYCGLAELRGRYYVCETKNLYDKKCNDFTPRGASSTAHDCRSCAHNVAPMSMVVIALQRTMGRTEEGRRLCQTDVVPALDAQADFDYRHCVDGAGFVHTRPGMLPVCELLSTSSTTSVEASFVVGPVVNSAAHCAAWQEGSNATSEEIAANVNVYAAEAAFRVIVKAAFPYSINETPAPPGTPEWAGFEHDLLPLINAAGNAESTVIEYCLGALGLDPDWVAALGSQYMLAVWDAQRDRSEDNFSPMGAVYPLVDGGVVAHPLYKDVQVRVGKGQPPAQFMKLPGTLDGSIYIAYRYIDKKWRYTTIASLRPGSSTFVYTEKGEWVPFKLHLKQITVHSADHRDGQPAVSMPLDSAKQGDSVGFVGWLR